MLPPIIIPELSPADPIDPANDYVILRQGLNDKKATISQISNLQLGDNDLVPGEVLGSDVLLLGRYVSPLSYDNYIVPVQKIGFLKDTVCWFYMSVAPLYWQTLANTGDAVLATRAGNANQTYGTAGVRVGTWQQEGHALTVQEIPPHTHRVDLGADSTDTVSSANSARMSKNIKSRLFRTGDGSSQGLQGLPHNHGNTWRPQAVVGILAIKTDV